MANESDKRKDNLHTKKTFYDLVEQIPIIGLPTRKLLERKGGVMKKIRAFGLIGLTVIVLAAIFLVWLHYEHNGQQTINNNKTASTDGNNSPAITGNKNALIQNSPNATLNYGVSDETYKQIREGMEAIQKLKEVELRADFKYGYILFTATERNEVVPLNSPMDDILTVDWKSGWNVSFSDNTINLRMPTITYEPIKVRFSNCTVQLPKDGTLVSGLYLGEHIIAFKVISIKKDSVIIAMGIKDRI